MTKQKLQWHPAFVATLQIDFAKEAEELTFLSEFELNRMPLRIDALIIKKNRHVALKNDIGKILRGHNVFEYKSPTDILTIDDFYKVYGYACFYKSHTERTDEISQDDLTISFVCSSYPRKMLKQLQAFRHLKSYKVAPGLYYIQGDPFPIQLIITRDLSPDTHCWLSSLRTDLVPDNNMNQLLKDYEQHEHSNLYKSALDLIVRANPIAMEEAKNMCEALKELFAEDLEKGIKEAAEEITKEVTQQVTQQVTYHNLLLLIELLLEDGYTPTSICEKLHIKFSLNYNTLMDYIVTVQEKSH